MGKKEALPRHTETDSHVKLKLLQRHMDRVKRIWYLSPMRAAKVQASLRIRAVSPEPSLLHTSRESRGTFRQKARSLAPLNGWACAVKICHDGCSKTQIRLTGLICGFIVPHEQWFQNSRLSDILIALRRNIICINRTDKLYYSIN